ncbi:MAG TPA: hypothetical protein VKB19_12895 [Pedobacter sp.]|nr:hypothetical protein [Pedobacter sp.]
MPVIRLETLINADQNTVFDLSRSIDLHQISTAQTNERVVAGRFSGLILLDESVAKLKLLNSFNINSSKMKIISYEIALTNN